MSRLCVLVAGYVSPSPVPVRGGRPFGLAAAPAPIIRYILASAISQCTPGNSRAQPTHSSVLLLTAVCSCPCTQSGATGLLPLHIVRSHSGCSGALIVCIYYLSTTISPATGNTTDPHIQLYFNAEFTQRLWMPNKSLIPEYVTGYLECENLD